LQILYSESACELLSFHASEGKHPPQLNTEYLLRLIMSSQVTFIYKALLATQIVSKQLYGDNMKIIQQFCFKNKIASMSTLSEANQ